jgi:5-methylcytosine-specific restriction endonuclease McrA
MRPEANQVATESSASEFADLLRSLHAIRNERQRAFKAAKQARQILSAAERKQIFTKTAGRCHICGGDIEGAWQADHVLSHSGGGGHRADNYLPAHALCNNYRWDYSSEEFQHILQLGVWIRTQIERETPIGRTVAAAYLAHENTRLKRRRTTVARSSNKCL